MRVLITALVTTLPAGIVFAACCDGPTSTTIYLPGSPNDPVDAGMSVDVDADAGDLGPNDPIFPDGGCIPFDKGVYAHNGDQCSENWQCSVYSVPCADMVCLNGECKFSYPLEGTPCAGHGFCTADLDCCPL